MDSLWNWQIDRILAEVTTLRSKVQPLTTFADKIGLSLIDEDQEDHLNREIKQISSIMNLWVGIAKETIDTTDGIKAITAASRSFSTVALREFMRNYLVKSQSNGGYLIHLCYGRLGEIFSDPLKYEVTNYGLKLTRFYNTDLPTIDFAQAQEFTIDEGIPQLGDAVFLPGDEAMAVDVDTATILNTFPYLNKKGQPTNSVWALVK